MAKVLLKNKKTDEEKWASLGHSFPALIFGCLVPLFNREFSLFFGTLIVSFFVTGLRRMHPFGWGVYWLYSIIFSYFYNEYHIKKLMEKGYEPVDEEGVILLRNEKDNSQERVILGFNIFPLVFGFFVPLYQRHFSLFFKMLLISICISIVSITVFFSYLDLELVLLIINAAYGLALGFRYNEYRMKELIKKGYRPVDEKGEKLLKEYSIKF